MNHIHKRRFAYIFLLSLGLAMGSALILYALKQNLNVFLTPSQIKTAHLSTDDHIRLGGLVKKNSLVHDTNSLTVQFIMTDYKNDISVRYTGVLPDLFREGKGAIVEGSLNTQGFLIADRVLAKHDENYLPKKVYLEMRRNA